MRVLSVEKLIETQSQKHKERLVSQYTRLLDSSPYFPTYYSIDGVNSSAELGTRDIAEYIGVDSPIKFKKIIGMPMYSVNAITAEITYDEDLGTYTEFSDDSMVLVSVLRPNPGDHFILPDFNPEIIFAVTDVKIRAIRGEDHYITTYSVVPTSRLLNIEAQVVETYKTIFRNIGTEDKVLIKVEDYNILQDYLESYRLIHTRYLDENYDSLMGYLKTPEWLDEENEIGFGTCKYLIKYLMDNRVFYFDEVLESIFAFEMVLPFEAKHNKLYNRTFPLLRFIKQQVTEGSVYIAFRPLPVSLFNEISDEVVEQSISFTHVAKGAIHTPDYKEVLLYDETFTDIIVSKDYTTASPLQTLIAKFVNDEEISLSEFNQISDDYEVSDLFRMYFIPMVLVILKIRIKSIQTTGNR